MRWSPPRCMAAEPSLDRRAGHEAYAPRHRAARGEGAKAGVAKLAMYAGAVLVLTLAEYRVYEFISARGVREKRQPPTPIWSPSLTRPTASSRLVSFSAADLGLASVRRRAATKSFSAGFR